MHQPSPNVALCLCADQNFFPAACVTARRILDLSDGGGQIAIIHDSVPDADLERARDFLGERLRLIDGGPHLEGVRFPTNGRLSRATFLRLFVDKIRQFEQIETLIYLDSDIYLHRNPFDLAGLRHTAGPIIAAHDLSQVVVEGYRDRLRMTAGAPYFNSGIMVMHLPWLRDCDGLERTRRFAQEHPDDCRLLDQDALNHAFQNEWQTLDWRWNVMSDFLQDHFGSSQIHARHFTGAKPWQSRRFNIADEYVELYRAAFRRSPWPGFFQEQSSADLFRARRRRILKRLETGAKSMAINLLGQRLAERQALRLKIVSQLGAVLEQLSQDAAEGRPARRYMERFVLSPIADAMAT